MLMEISNEKSLRKEIVDLSQRCGAQGWCPGTLGNISVLDSASGKIYIKKSGADLSRLGLSDILTIDLNGNVLSGLGKPSIETNLHIGVYKTRKEAKAVFHVHPPYSTAFAVAGKKITMVTEAAKIVLVAVPLLPRSLPGSAELATNVTHAFKNSKVKAVLLKEHGLVSIGETLEEAYHTTALVEDTAKVALMSSLVKNFF